MTNRRDILQIGLGASLLSVTPLTSFAKSPDSRFYKVVYDERFESGRAFASEAKDAGADVHAIQGDITALWYRDLYHRWRSPGSKAALAGLTTEMSLFCLENLARDAGLRLVHLKALEDGASSRHAARDLMQLNGARLAPLPPLSHPSAADTALVSWIIAPKRA